MVLTPTSYYSTGYITLCPDIFQLIPHLQCLNPMNCCFIAPPQTGHRFAFDLIAYHAQVKLLFSIYLRYSWSRCRSDDTAERSGKQNFLHIIGVEFDPKHYKGKWPCTTKTLYNKKHWLVDFINIFFYKYFYIISSTHEIKYIAL